MSIETLVGDDAPLQEIDMRPITIFSFRRDTLENWQYSEGVLLDGEIAVVTDVEMFAVGDGSSPFYKLDLRPLEEAARHIMLHGFTLRNAGKL